MWSSNAPKPEDPPWRGLPWEWNPLVGVIMEGDTHGCSTSLTPRWPSSHRTRSEMGIAGTSRSKAPGPGPRPRHAGNSADNFDT